MTMQRTWREELINGKGKCTRQENTNRNKDNDKG